MAGALHQMTAEYNLAEDRMRVLRDSAPEK